MNPCRAGCENFVDGDELTATPMLILMKADPYYPYYLI
jgi:hypothetical protein